MNSADPESPATTLSTTSSSCPRSADDLAGLGARQLVLQSELLAKNSAGISFDLGGSRFKVAFIRELDQTDGHETQKADMSTIVLAAFPRGGLEDAVAFVKKHSPSQSTVSTSSGSSRPPATLQATGMALGPEEIAYIESSLNVKVTAVDEFKLLTKAANELTKFAASTAEETEDIYHGSPSDWVQQQVGSMLAKVQAWMMSLQLQQLQLSANLVACDGEVRTPDTSTAAAAATENAAKSSVTDAANRETVAAAAPAAAAGGGGVPTDAGKKYEPEYPYFLLTGGSGTSVTMMNRDGSYVPVAGMANGGISLMALSKLLCGTENYDEFMSLAEAGDETNVSSVVTDVLLKPDYYNALPDNAVVYHFGKVLNSAYSGSRREDVARALLVHLLINVVQFTMWTAIARNVDTVHVCGGIFEHRLSRDLFSFFFTTYAFFVQKPTMKFKILKLSTFLPVIGGLLDD